MALDFGSLLMSVGFAGTCLAATLFIAWLSARGDGFLLTWAIGAALIVVSVFVYSTYVNDPSAPVVMAAFALLLTGLAVAYGAGYQFRDRTFPIRRVAIAVAASLAVSLPAFATEYDGIGFVMTNLAAAMLLVLSARAYWQVRAEAPLPISSLAALYAIAGASFALCAVVLVAEGSWTIGRAPEGWAESINLAVSIGGITGIGALSLALNQTRMAHSHRQDALTDALTGLLNRRALFDRYGTAPVPADTAVVVFDLDDFKEINDRHGHAAGDEVIVRFAAALTGCVREHDAVARLGGEEFAVVLERVTASLAYTFAERVRGIFEAAGQDAPTGMVSCTVSAGLSFADRCSYSFDDLLRQADAALYSAKRGGRNRVAAHGLRLAS